MRLPPSLARLAIWPAGVAFLAVVAGMAVESDVGAGSVVFLVVYAAIAVMGRLAGVPRGVLIFTFAYGLVAFTMASLQWASSPGVDAQAYVHAASRLAENGLVNTTGVSPTVLVEGKQGYVYMLAILFVLVGASGVAAAGLNSALLCALLVMCYVNARLVDPTAAKYALALAACFPSLLVWGPTPIREAAVWLLVALACHGCLKLGLSDSRARPVLLVVVSGVGLLYFRGPFAVVLVPALVGAVLLSRRGSISVRSLGVLAGGFLLAAALFGPVLSDVLVRFDSDSVSVSRNELSAASSGFFTVGSSGGFRGFSYGLGRVLLGPYPWERGTAGIAWLEAMLWAPVLALAFVGLRRHGTKVLVLAVGVFVLAVVVSLSSGNYGTLLRMRASMVPFLSVLGALGFAAIRARRFAAPVGTDVVPVARLPAVSRPNGSCAGRAARQ